MSKEMREKHMQQVYAMEETNRQLEQQKVQVQEDLEMTITSLVSERNFYKDQIRQKEVEVEQMVGAELLPVGVCPLRTSGVCRRTCGAGRRKQ